MAGRKNQQTRKMFLGWGSKHRWQDNPAKIPANIMTRLRASRHNQKDLCQRNQPGDHACQCARNAGRQTNLLKKKKPTD
jgi:hypothetical protein